MLELFKNRRVLALLALTITLCTVAIIMLISTINRLSAEKASGTQAIATTVTIPDTNPAAPAITPSTVDDTNVVDWKTLRVDSCGAPISEYLKSVNVEFKGGVGVWNTDQPCMDWWNTSTYLDGVLQEGNIVIDAVINNQWVFAHLPYDARLARYDSTILHLSNHIANDESKAVWVFYDFRSSETITLTLYADGSVSQSSVLTDLADVVGNMEPDNACNWPHTLTYVGQMLDEYPDSEVIFVSKRWEELDGCNVGYTYVENRQVELLVVIQNGEVRTTMLTDLTYAYVVPADKSGNLFYNNIAEFVTINPDNSVAKVVGNPELLNAITRVTTSYDSMTAYAIYQQSLSTPLATGTQFEIKNYQRPINDAGEETANLYPFTFRSEGKWYTGIIAYDFESGQYYGPFVVDNIREVVRWQSAPGQLTGYYNDGQSLTLTLSAAP